MGKGDLPVSALDGFVADLPAADVRALHRVRTLRPHALGLRRVGEVVSDSARRVFHAGPPYRAPADMPAPVLHSAAQAAVFEGWCADVAEAIAALRAGRIRSAAAQDHRLLVPLAGVLTASMAVLEIADPAAPLAPLHVALNEGQVHATRLGRVDHGLLPHLRWLNGDFADWLAQCLAAPLPLLPLLARARAEGDDCHARTVAGSALVAVELLRRGPPATDRAQTFLCESPAFALNFWMGAAALAARAAEGTTGASLITRAGGNGVEFGIQLASRPGLWVRGPAPLPRGAIEAAHATRSAIGALGDSAVVDFCGLGGQSLQRAPLVVQGVSAVLPEDALQRPARVLASAALDFGAGLGATSAARCVAAGVGPLVLIGMIDAQGQAGRIGGGVVDVPVALFERALATR